MSITFGDLWRNAQKISAALVNTNIGLNNPIGVYIPKGGKMIESFAGINMSGNFYVPLDTKSPVSRVSSIIKTLESKVLITDRSHIETLRDFTHVRILVAEDIIEGDINIENAFHSSLIRLILILFTAFLPVVQREFPRVWLSRIVV